MLNKLNRRTFVGFCSSAFGMLLTKQVEAAVETPSATEGPYYPEPSMRFDDVDNDLVKVESMVRDAGGDIITLTGQVTDKTGQPRVGHRIEIWQCDANGKYMHTDDPSTAEQDMGFQGFGHDITDADGRYRFRTIKPVSYPGRTPHIHAKLFDLNGKELLTSQFYLAAHPANTKDRIFNAMSQAEADSVTMVFNGKATNVDVVV